METQLLKSNFSKKELKRNSYRCLGFLVFDIPGFPGIKRGKLAKHKMYLAHPFSVEQKQNSEDEVAERKLYYNAMIQKEFCTFANIIRNSTSPNYCVMPLL